MPRPIPGTLENHHVRDVGERSKSSACSEPQSFFNFFPGNSDLFFSLLETRAENIRRDWSHFHHVQWHANPSCQILQVFHKKNEFATMKLRFRFYNCDFRFSNG